MPKTAPQPNPDYYDPSDDLVAEILASHPKYAESIDPPMLREIAGRFAIESDDELRKMFALNDNGYPKNVELYDDWRDAIIETLGEELCWDMIDNVAGCYALSASFKENPVPEGMIDRSVVIRHDWH